METIKDILIRRDKCTEQEADDLIEDARKDFNDALEEGDIERAENICETYFGLEPDYLDEFIIHI